MSLYFCSECRYPPLAWRAGRGYCLNHALTYGIEIAPAPVSSARQIAGNGFDLRNGARGKNKFEKKMAALEAELKSSGDWEDEQANYKPDLFSTSKADERVIPDSEILYTGLNGELKVTPF